MNENIQIIPSSAPSRNKNGPRSFDRRTAAIAALRLETSTYLVDPLKSSDASVVERYTNFADMFSIGEYSTKIARIIGEDSNLESILQKLSTLMFVD